eukprot:1597049-Rhodomonas_salina.5
MRQVTRDQAVGFLSLKVRERAARRQGAGPLDDRGGSARQEARVRCNEAHTAEIRRSRLWNSKLNRRFSGTRSEVCTHASVAALPWSWSSSCADTRTPTHRFNHQTKAEHAPRQTIQIKVGPAD